MGITRPISIFSLLPCHSLPGYSYYHDIGKEFELKQLECPPNQYRRKFYESSRVDDKLSHILSVNQPQRNTNNKVSGTNNVHNNRELYNDGNKPIPELKILEKFRIAQNSNWLVIYQKDAVMKVLWLHRNGFFKRDCFFHTHMPLGPEHDTHMCVYEKKI